MSQIAWLRIGMTGACVACTLFVFHPAFDNGFWRDDFVLLERAHAASMRPEILLERWVEPFNRPLAQLLFHLQYEAWGLEPGLYLVCNVLLHALNAALLFMLLQFPLGAPAAAGAALLFALGFGFHGKSVLWAANLPQLLATAFVLATAIAGLRAQLERTPQARLAAMATAGLFYALALLTNESGIMAIVMVAGLMWPHRRSLSSLVRKLAILVAVCAAYLFMQIVVGSGIGQSLDELQTWLGLPIRAVNLAALMLVPLQSESTFVTALSPLATRVLELIDQIRPICGFTLLVLCGLWFWRGSGAVRWLLVSYAAFLLPFGFIQASAGGLDIRYAYLPATCWCGLMAMGFRWLWLHASTLPRMFLGVALMLALYGEVALVRRIESRFDAWSRSPEGIAAIAELHARLGAGH